MDPQLVLPADTELWLTSWLRKELKSRNYKVTVSNKEPPETTFPLKTPHVIIRDDGGTQRGPVTFTRSIGITVLGGTRTDDAETMSLARLVYALVTSQRVVLADGSPITVVDFDASNGVFHVADEANTTRAYMSVTYHLVGTIID